MSAYLFLICCNDVVVWDRFTHLVFLKPEQYNGNNACGVPNKKIKKPFNEAGNLNSPFLFDLFAKGINTNRAISNST